MSIQSSETAFAPPTITLDGHDFTFVESISPKRDASGVIEVFRPQEDYPKATDSALHKHGDGTFCKFKLSVKKSLTDADTPNRFYYFEIFRDEAAAASHWETENFRTWWATVEGMLDGETQRISTMRTVFPSDHGLEQQKAGLLDW